MGNLNKLHATHHESLKMKSTLVAEHKKHQQGQKGLQDGIRNHVSNNDRKLTQHVHLNLKRSETSCEPELRDHLCISSCGSILGFKVKRICGHLWWIFAADTDYRFQNNQKLFCCSKCCCFPFIKEF